MKRFNYLVLVLLLFSFSFVLAGESSVDVNIVNPGCDLRSNPVVGEFLPPGECSNNGKWSCDATTDFEHIISYSTLTDLNGCSYGADSLEGITYFCCPNGYYCQDNGTIQCAPILEDCGSFTDRDSCEETQCYWFGESDSVGICVNSIREIGCEIYDEEASCEEDLNNLGQKGLGTDVCGSQVTVNRSLYIIPYDSCRCEWVSGSCNQVYNTTPSIWQGEPNSFNCARSFDVGECSEAGSQLVSWIATIIDIKGSRYSGGINDPDLILDAQDSGCVNGNETRICGEAALRLSGFSLLAFLLSGILIVIVYFLRGDIFNFKK